MVLSLRLLLLAVYFVRRLAQGLSRAAPSKWDLNSMSKARYPWLTAYLTKYPLSLEFLFTIIVAGN